jgi:hypothetical protein
MFYIFIAGIIFFIIMLVKRGSSEHADNATVSIILNDKGRPILTLTDSSGRQITNPSIIRKVKQTEDYKREVKELIEKRKQGIAEEKLRAKEEKEREKKANKYNIGKITAKP